MKLVKIIEIHRELLIFLRKNGIKLDYTELTEMYHYFKRERAKPGSKHEVVLRDIEKKFGIGHTKAWDIIKIMDRDV